MFKLENYMPNYKYVIHIGIFYFSIFLSTLSHAQQSDAMAFSVFWPCMGNASFCAPRILANGAIESNTYIKLSEFLSNQNHTYKLSLKPTICFNSVGGDLGGALALGSLIRKLDLDTCLAPEYSRVVPNSGGNEEVFVSEAICASACTFALAGGVNRVIEANSKYGVHQFYKTNGNIGDSSTQANIVVLASYLEKMGIDRQLLDTASLIKPEDIYWLTPLELQKFGVDNMTIITTKWELDALKDGTVVATISQFQLGNRVTLSIFKKQNRSVLVVGFTQKENFNVIKPALDALNSQLITLRIDGRELANYKNIIWTQDRNTIYAWLPLSTRVIKSLRNGNLFKFVVSVPHVNEQYNPSAEFSLHNSGAFLAAALK